MQITRAKAWLTAPTKPTNLSSHGARSLSSIALNERRQIEVILPANYANDTSNYDVWYVLDGEWNTHTFTNIFSYLVAVQFAPPAIIVSVPNWYVNGFNLRDRDLTPSCSPTEILQPTLHQAIS
jgi:predicted alpha/beta superfamily hydrolase